MTPVGIADYLRVASALSADAALRLRIATILGVADTALSEAVERTGTVRPVRDTPPSEQEAVADAETRAFDGSESTGSTGPLQRLAAAGAEDTFEVERLPGADADLPLVALPRLNARGKSAAALPHEPLFHPARQRAHTSAVLAAERLEGEVDEALLVSWMVRAMPIRVLPRRGRMTLARGAQVLLDLSDAMLPFRRDQIELLAVVERLTPDDLLEVRTFRRHPAEASRGARGAQRGYEAPRRGTPVVALTDLGLHELEHGYHAAVNAWLEFVRRLGRSGVPFVALVPYPPTAWPAMLREQIAIVQWDRAATVSATQRAALRARRR